MIDMTSNVDGFFLALTIQFGYVNIFHGVFPLSSLFIALSNLFIIFITERMYSTITKRSLSQQVESIGIWNQIFESIGFISVLASAFIAAYTTDTLDDYFDGNKATVLLVILVCEHFILGMRYFISKLINLTPPWVRKRQQINELLKKKYSKGGDFINSQYQDMGQIQGYGNGGFGQEFQQNDF